MKVDDIFTKNDFLGFLDKYAKELRFDEIRNEKSWQFVQALAAWIEDMEGYYKNTNQYEVYAAGPSWRIFADALVAASEYE